MTVIHQKNSISIFQATYEGAKTGGAWGFTLGTSFASTILFYRGTAVIVEISLRALGRSPEYALYEEDCNKMPFQGSPACVNPLLAPLPFTALVISASTLAGTAVGAIFGFTSSLLPEN